MIAELQREVLELKERRTTPTAGSPRPRPSAAPQRVARSRSCVHAAIERDRAGAAATPPITPATERTRPAARRATPWSRSAARDGSPLATIVFEAKNKRLSKNDAWTELNACMGERDAAFAVLVVAGEDKVPAGLEELTEYQGNKIIAVARPRGPGPARAAARLPLRPRARARWPRDRRARGRRGRRARRRRGGGRAAEAGATGSASR